MRLICNWLNAFALGNTWTVSLEKSWKSNWTVVSISSVTLMSWLSCTSCDTRSRSLKLSWLARISTQLVLGKWNPFLLANFVWLKTSRPLPAFIGFLDSHALDVDCDCLSPARINPVPHRQSHEVLAKPAASKKTVHFCPGYRIILPSIPIPLFPNNLNQWERLECPRSREGFQGRFHFLDYIISMDTPHLIFADIPKCERIPVIFRADIGDCSVAAHFTNSSSHLAPPHARNVAWKMLYWPDISWILKNVLKAPRNRNSDLLLHAQHSIAAMS